jgi:hypothetical protein
MVSAIVALDKAREQTSRAGEIMRRLRDFAVRRESELRIENVDEIVEQILSLALVDAKVRGVSTRVQLAPAVKRVLADKIQIGQVILNIARNAIEAMEEHFSERTLTISTGIDDLSQEVVVRISDTGPGLAPEVKTLFSLSSPPKTRGWASGSPSATGSSKTTGGCYQSNRTIQTARPLSYACLKRTKVRVARGWSRRRPHLSKEVLRRAGRP